MKKTYIIKLSLIFLSILFVLIFSSVRNEIDAVISSQLNRITGEVNPDSNIVLINITSEDIEQIGPWPIKRSYYALLIQQLNKYKVRKIGLEVFLSTKFSTQSLYDNVLLKEINQSDKVILSSLAGEIEQKNNFFTSDEFSLPSIKLLDKNISSGHINFIKDNGFEIPLEIKVFDSSEKAFCYKIYNQITDEEKIKVNISSSWNNFKQYSLIDFFQLAQNEGQELNQLKDKIVLVGVTDPQLAALIKTPYDDEMPGLALHAFALSNLLNKNYYNTNYYFLSILLSGLLVVLIGWIFLNTQKRFVFYGISFAIILLIAIVITKIFFIEISFAAFLLPFIALLISDLALSILSNRTMMQGIFNETELLKKLLEEKEKALSSLQKELNVSNHQNSIEVVTKIRELKADIERLKDNEDDKKVVEISSNTESKEFYGIVYRSNAMDEVVNLIKKASPTDATILVTGESGTGKELVARAIHKLSKRSDQSFVAINCAALSESLLESELFGHVKGAFTGAISDKAGKFELANKGTIFLDEIGETSENFQVKLLRVLQSGEYDKVGASSTSKTNVRVIAATNKDLKQRVKENKFREDLFYRLNVIEIHLKSLSERKDDIEPIIKHFLNSDEKHYQISSAALNALINNNWKGNIRELESAIKRAKVFCDSTDRNIIQLNDLPSELVKNIKLNFEDLVIESLRNKKFSHASINETAKELGNLNRTIISENFRGFAFKCFVENNFDIERTISVISNSDNKEIILKVNAKMETWIGNIKKDLAEMSNKNFEEVKNQLASKYKNLPQKFHLYLDEVINHLSNSK